MSLADKIMKITAPDNVAQHPLCMGGFSVAQQEAGNLAAEADELMAEMGNALASIDPDDLPRMIKGQVVLAINHYNTYKERNNEQ